MKRLKRFGQTLGVAYTTYMPILKLVRRRYGMYKEPRVETPYRIDEMFHARLDKLV